MSGGLEGVDLAALPGAVRDLLVAQQAALEAALAERDAARSDSDALRARQADLQEANAELGASNARLEHLVKEFQKALYGKKAERFDPDQRDLLFEDLETAVAETEAAVDAGRPRPGPKPPRRNLGRLPAELPRIERVIEPESRACPCGCGEMTRIGEDRSERLDVIPAQFRVIATIRPRYACKACGAGVVQAPAPAHLVEGGLPTEGLIAHMLVGKYCDHLPLYRQAQIYSRSGIELDRSTLAGWAGRAAFHLAPVVERLAAHLKASGKLFMDETRLPVLDPGRGRTKTGYLWALARDDRAWGGADPPGVVYFYADGRGGRHAEAFLDSFCGILQVDGYAGYNRLTAAQRDGGALRLVFCWAHARRKLKEAFDASGSPIAAEGLAQIAALYAIEAEIRGKPAARRLAIRQARSAPLVEAFGDVAQGEAQPRLRPCAAGRETRLYRQPLGRAAAVPRRRPHRHRFQRRREPHPPDRPLAEERIVRRPRRGRPNLGPHRLADRDRKAQRRRTLCLPQGDPAGARRRPSPVPHRRPPALGIQVNGLSRWGQRTAYLLHGARSVHS